MLASFVSLIFIGVSLVSCNTFGGPVTSAQNSFQSWTQINNIPYRNAHYEAISNDGTFALVFLKVELRKSAQANWTDMEAEINCRNIGSNWSCDQNLNFSLSKVLIAGTQTAIVETATSWTNQLSATGTAEAVFAMVTQQEFSRILSSINVNAKDVKVIKENSGSMFDSGPLIVTFSISNDDNKSHKVNLFVYVHTIYDWWSAESWEGLLAPEETREETIYVDCYPYCSHYNEEDTTLEDIEIIIQYVDDSYVARWPNISLGD